MIPNEKEIFDNLIRQDKIQHIMIKYHMTEADATKFYEHIQDVMKGVS